MHGECHDNVSGSAQIWFYHDVMIHEKTKMVIHGDYDYYGEYGDNDSDDEFT